MNNKFKAIIKIVSAMAPALLFGASVGGLAGVSSTYAGERARIYKLYRETDADFALAQSREMKSLDESYNMGLISEEEYKDKKDYLSSDDFTKSIIELDTSLDDEIKSLKDTKQKYVVSSLVLLTSMIASNGVCWFFYPNKSRELLGKATIDWRTSKLKTKEPEPIVLDLDEAEKISKRRIKRVEDYDEEIVHKK